MSVDWLPVVAGSGVLSAAITALANRRGHNAHLIGEAYQAINALTDRVTDLETGLKAEQTEHSRTRNLLRLALTHIREVVAWGAGDRSTSLPEPPAELLSEP